jgi:hypothetical protein
MKYLLRNQIPAAVYPIMTLSPSLLLSGPMAHHFSFAWEKRETDNKPHRNPI